MNNTLPIYLLSDSQLLFSHNAAGQHFLQSIITEIDKPDIKAAYIGWSNGDQPEFYELFKEGMKHLHITNCSMISADFNSIDKENLLKADVILLAGGDVNKGWQRLLETKTVDIIKKKYTSGAILIGISAGAIQLGWQTPFTTDDKYEEMMQLVPFIIGAHDEVNQWIDLKSAVLKSGKEGIGIPFGGGLKYYPDQRIEIINKPEEIFYFTNNA
ncbi:Type 1 glutamine amidotransferase-like domain-containing protein [Fulvivirga sp. 29W222]|uniref:Type 1 glutamine amidotransferase-like domain-containing protein n=1 Tax=Fulvivirga marina TaxID=2494733 RepID=A0A937KBC7_9BACT|nr:Type 1 glutamine amidotransferase-like domain-containing protein [Fulvivirga marina]MBL6445774.1 Type 1 glutamine amidotransferase-like domain-containing protein [Fulvivirga marina]